MLLKCGISGFYSKNLTIPFTDEEEFIKICYSFSNDSKCSVKRYRFTDLIRNYFVVEMEVANETISVLLNQHYPFISFCKMNDGSISNFIDIPVLKKKFCNFYHVLSVEDLMIPISIEILQNSELDGVELEQIKYWKPRTIGEIIFNDWD